MIMEEKINITELLKKCCVRTKLYCPMFGDCFLYAVSTDKEKIYPITIYSPNDYLYIHFSDNGTLFTYKTRCCFYNSGSECLLFPSSDYRSWEGVRVVDGELVIPVLSGTEAKEHL
jgi:hypothetical protein